MGPIPCLFDSQQKKRFFTTNGIFDSFTNNTELIALVFSLSHGSSECCPGLLELKIKTADSKFVLVREVSG